MAYVAVDSTEVDAKSPLDDNLLEKMKGNFDYLYGQVASAKVFLEWDISGPLRRLQTYKREIGAPKSTQAFTPSSCRVQIRKSGLSGTLALDIRKISQTKTPITGIDFQFDGPTQSIANIAPALATQTITRLATQISTQSITVAKATIAVSSIVQVPGTNLWRYNLASAPDSFWAVGKSILAASCTSGGNNGTFAIVEANQSGHPSIVVSNASGVAQTGAAGTLQLQLFSYNFTNPVDSNFTVGESALFASHTSALNDGTIAIAAVNTSGNNIWVYNSAGVAQGGVAGNVNVQRFRYTFLSAPSVTDFIVGEKAKMATHTTGANNGNFTIVAVNALSVDVYNSAGVTQGGVAGTVNTNRWIYSLSSDPSAQITAGDSLQLETHTTTANNGEFTAKEVKRGALNNVVVYNESGVAQAGVVGNTRTSRKLIKFTADQSATYTVGDYVSMLDTVSGLYYPAGNRNDFQILQVNRGGGSAFNIVVSAYGTPNQASPAGFVMTKATSIFVVKPSISADLTGLTANRTVYAEFTNFVAAVIPAGTQLALYVTSMLTGDTQDLTVNLQ